MTKLLWQNLFICGSIFLIGKASIFGLANVLEGSVNSALSIHLSVRLSVTLISQDFLTTFFQVFA